jgi:monothiol glutaredoxin
MSDALTRIKEQVTNNKVVLYMKGSPSFPQCGFSSRAAQVLQLSGLQENDFLAVDVLQDMEIRQGIKEFSNWPTIPQLYVQGEFVGGSDILTEMYQNGEIQKKLQAVFAS